MTTKKKSSTVTPTKVKYVNGPHYVSSYCNNIAFAVNAIDLVLIFGEVIDVVGDQAVVERRARVTFAPAQAKMLHWVLTEQIRQYEEKAGPIVLPKGIQLGLSGGTIKSLD